MNTTPAPCAPASATAPVAGAWVPDGYELVAVRNFNDLMLALDRADRKGYMPDAMAGEWEAFQYITKERAQEQGQGGDTK